MNLTTLEISTKKIFDYRKVAQAQIDYILVTFGWKMDEKLAKVCIALPGRLNA